MAKGLALFDLDGTITTKDTMLEFIRFTKGEAAFLWGFGLMSPVLVLMKLKLLTNKKAKERTLKWFFGGMDESEFNRRCADFSDKILESLIRPGARKQLNWHKAQGHDVYIVSASAENWLKKWCAKEAVQLLATKLEIIDKKITGKLAGNNCHGEEKVNRIRQALELDQYETIWAYGDTSGDKPMLALAGKASYKPFRS